MAGLKKILSKKLPAKELKKLRAGFDIIGKIAVIEIPAGLKKREKAIARAVLTQNSAIKTVLKKVGKHSGQYRTQKTKFLTGENNKEALHKENGVLMKLNVEKCYFSPRLSTERMRIAKLIKPGEKVLVMFSGIAPYPLILAKHSPSKLIVGIEKNPVAHKYALENLVINKIPAGKVILYNDDVRKKIPLLKQKFDRIIMPLPKTGGTFLGLAFKALKKKGLIHLYQFAKKSEFTSVVEKALSVCQEHNKQCHVLQVVKAGQHAPYNYRICIDIQLLN